MQRPTRRTVVRSGALALGGLAVGHERVFATGCDDVQALSIENGDQRAYAPSNRGIYALERNRRRS